ncbi:MAG: hypothetical protein ACFCGT_18900 [Sandaracinaceae bacterium]
MARSRESQESIRRRAERALEQGLERRQVEGLLRRLLDVAPEGDPDRTFAHRHLAELCLEEDPWAAALHLRKVLSQRPNDDVVHSLMALAWALLGHYRAAASAYRRALLRSPRNPWYHHNLGHLLDVALDVPRDALHHLEMAYRIAEPPEHEITASLAHCLARVNRLDEARELALDALRDAPTSKEHRSLLGWIDRGAPPGETVPPKPVPRYDDGERPDVDVLLERNMRAAGFTARQVERARALWADYREERTPRVKKPAICAAAVHYAIALVHGLDGVTQAAIARRYGVAPKSVSTRYGDIRDTLSLRPGDPRYAGR